MAFPDYYLNSVFSIDLDKLREQGKKYILLDLDNTLLPRDKNEIPEELKAWARSLTGKGFKVCFLSNNWHDRIIEVAGDLGFELVSKAVKPLPPAYLMALHKLGAKSNETVMIGDQLFTDVLGGALMGITTIMVLPLSAHDLTHTLILRKLEKLIIRDRQPQESM